MNLKGLEGYVPGGYWEAYNGTVNSQSKPKAPQPVPRTKSPPNTTSTPEKNNLENEEWYHGKLSRPESEKLLSNFSNGVYLIRESVNRVSICCIILFSNLCSETVSKVLFFTNQRVPAVSGRCGIYQFRQF